MKYIARIVGYMLIIAVILGLFFLFEGQPDLWDKLHAYAMGPPCPVNTYLTFDGKTFKCKRVTE